MRGNGGKDMKASKEKPQTQPSTDIEIGIRNNLQPRRQLQKNVHPAEFVVDAEVAADTQHRFIVVVVVPFRMVVVAHADERPGAVIKIERFAAADGLEPQPMHVDKKEIVVVVVEIPGEQNVEPHGFGIAEMQVEPRRVADLKTDADVASFRLGRQGVWKQEVESQEETQEQYFAAGMPVSAEVLEM